MERTYLRTSWKDRIFDAFNVIVLSLLIVVMLYPFLNQIAISFNDSADTVRGGITIWPRKFSLDAYSYIFQNQELLKASFISFLRVVVGTSLSVLATALLAYIVTINDFSGRKFIRRLFIITMYFSGGLIPFYLLIAKLKMIDTFTVLWLPGLFSAYHMLIMASYMQGIPDSLGESARLDGASEFRIFWQIILPISVPVIAAVSVFTAVGHWNSWFDCMIYNPSGNWDTLQVYLRRMLLEIQALQGLRDQQMAQSQYAALTAQTVRAATTIIVTAPIALVYPFFQKYFISGITIGAVKE